MTTKAKIIPYPDLGAWRAKLSDQARPLVVSNGCFDLLHAGHVSLLEHARNAGQTLLVGINSDEAIRALKGNSRPIISESHRLRLLAAMEAVSAVCLFPELDACEFLLRSRPDVYVKGGDYTLETINQNERRLIEQLGARIEFSQKLEGLSTSVVLENIARKIAR